MEKVYTLYIHLVKRRCVDRLYRILYDLCMIKTLSITEVRNNLPRLVNSVHKKLDEYTITVNGSPAAVLMSIDELESLRETLEIMSDKKLMRSIKQGEKEIAEGKGIPWEQVVKELGLD